LGIFKYLFWLAPVVMGIFFYVASQQQATEAKLNQEALEFDRDFAIAKSKFDSSWEGVAEEKSDKIKKLELRAQALEEKADKAYAKLEQASEQIENPNNTKE
jgi:hypothetical protein